MTTLTALVEVIMLRIGSPVFCTFLLLSISWQVQAQSEPKCFDAAKWMNACYERQTSGDFKAISTLVDIRFLGDSPPEVSNNWLLKNFPSIEEGGFKFDEKSRMTQDGCKSLSSEEEEATILNITGSSAHHVDLVISPESLTKSKSGLEAALFSAILAQFKITLEEIPARPNSLRFKLTQVTDNQLVESAYVINCGDKAPEKEIGSKSVESLKSRHDKLIADGVKETPEPEEGDRELAYINNKGKIVYLEKNQDDLKQEYTEAFEKYAATKEVTVKDLSIEKTIALQSEFLNANGTELSVGARYTAFNELRFARLMLFPKDEEKLIESNPEFKGKLKEIREQLKANQKLIAAQLDMPEGYWNYPDVPNDILETFAEAIGEALGKAVEKMGEGLIEGLKKGLQKGLNPKPEELL